MNSRIKKSTKVAVVILNWNGKDYLEKFLPVLIENSKSDFVQLFVADNGSTDSSVRFIQANFPEIKLVLFDKNYGFAAGYNRALDQIEAEYFVILNSDVEVSNNWIFPIINKMDEDLSVVAAMPKIKSYYNKEYFEYAGAAGGFIDKYGYPFCRGRILDKIEKDLGQYNNESEIFWASGACLFIRSEIFQQHSGFDEDFFAHMEEIDLCWRIKNAGYKIMYYSESEVFHVGGGALPKDNPKKLYLNYRNNLLMLLKNLSASKLIQILLIRLVLDGLSAFVYLLKFQFQDFAVVFKAHLSFYKLIPKFVKKREIIFCKNNIDHKEIYQRSIIYNYFVKKIDTFNKLCVLYK